MISSLFRQDRRRTTMATLYERVATASRAPGLYLSLNVPDTVEGRFEALCLHVVLVLRALRGRPAPADEIASGLAAVVAYSVVELIRWRRVRLRRANLKARLLR